MTREFRCWQLPDPAPTFEELLASVRFDDVTLGRRGAVLVEASSTGTPIVRTTTQYRTAAQPFRPLHTALARQISESGSLPQRLNNGLVEHYTSAYRAMKPHSDQAQDLADESWIALYSCYRDPERPARRLVVRPKEAGSGFELPLTHRGVVAFSLETNRRHVHAICLRPAAPENEWLGITFRTSKTTLRFIDGQPTLPSGERLTLASEEQRRELFQMRRRESQEMDFTYPSLAYTLSASDLLPPAP